MSIHGVVLLESETFASLHCFVFALYAPADRRQLSLKLFFSVFFKCFKKSHISKDNLPKLSMHRVEGSSKHTASPSCCVAC